MLRILLPVSSLLAACTPSPEKAAMPSPRPVSGTAVQSPSTSSPGGDASVAARGPILEPVSVAENPAPGLPADSPAEAQGRRILSTAFVRVGPDGHLTVELRNGRMLVLRDVVMRARDYCGAQVAGDSARARYCGGYAEVAAARPGGAPAPDQPDLAVANPVEPARSPTKGK